MKRKEIEYQIKKLLKSSSISNHNKKMIINLIETFKLSILKKIFSTLKKEEKKMNELKEKRNRIELKYQIMVEKLCNIQLKK